MDRDGDGDGIGLGMGMVMAHHSYILAEERMCAMVFMVLNSVGLCSALLSTQSHSACL